MWQIKIRLWRIGFAVLLAGANPPMDGGKALATSISDLSAVEIPGLLSRRIDGAAEDPIVPASAGDAVGGYLRLLNSHPVPARRSYLPDLPRLEIDDFMAFMIAADRYGGFGDNAGFNVDRRRARDWVRFWTDNQVPPETEQKPDYSAIAQAAYTPDIGYWLDGAIRSPFDTALPHRGAAGPRRAVPEDANSYTVIGRDSYVLEDQLTAVTAQKRGEPKKVKSFREFLLSIGSKIVRQPIVYVILLVSLGMLIASTRRRRRH